MVETINGPTMKRTMMLGVIGVLVATPLASAAPGLTVEARMFMHESGTLDEDLFAKEARPSVGILDYGVLSTDVMIIVKVPDGLGTKLNVTVKQGKQAVKRSWKVNVGTAFGIQTGHYAVLVPTDQCNPMTVTATVGKTSMTKVIDFNCVGD